MTTKSFSKLTTITFERKVGADPQIVSDNVLEYLQTSYKNENTAAVIRNMESRHWKLKEVSHRIYDHNNDMVYDSKLASDGVMRPSTSKTKVLQAIASYSREADRTEEEKKAAKELARRILAALEGDNT